MYDFIIIGAGISGLYIGNNIENNNYLIIEQKKRIGGRIKTFNKEVIYETGADRFSSHHKRLIKLINNMNLQKHIKEIESNKDCFLRNKKSKNVYNTSNQLNYTKIMHKLSLLNRKELIDNNILSLIEKYYDCETKNFIRDYCGYDNFIINSSAINIIEHYKMITSKFYSLECGFSKIVETLYENIKDKVNLGEVVINIKKHQGKYIVITNKRRYITKKLIITIPKENLFKIDFLRRNLKYLDSVSSSPYIRIFAQYPKINGKFWFQDINYTVTDTSIRKIIPENYENGLIQVCYNDNDSATYIRNIIANGNLKKFLSQNLKKIFNKDIPEPIFLNCHYWKYGNHFWLPLYDNKIVSNYMLNPLYNLYICGESYSNNQAWIEGALETSEKILFLLKNKSKHTKKKKKDILYYMKEVEKHNNRRSAWTVIDNKVYNITDMIQNHRHPGGNIIEMAMGKDITEIFKSIGHSKFSYNLLEKFYIGELKK